MKKEEKDEYKPSWIIGSNENVSYAHYDGNRIGLFVTFGFSQLGIGFNVYNQVLSKGGKPILKLIINILFITLNVTYHGNNLR